MSYRVLIQPRAEADIDEAFQFIAGRSPERADDWLAGLLKAVDTLRSMPERCPPARDAKALGKDIRQLLYGKGRSRYRILFAVRGDSVRILTVRHGARGPL